MENNIRLTAGGSLYIRLTDIENDTVPLYISADVPCEILSAKSETPELAEIDENLNITPKKEGKARFSVTAKVGGEEASLSCELTVARGKSRATYMTAEKAQAARENVKKYAWARKEAEEKYISAADSVCDHIDEIYDMVASNGVPRGTHVGSEGDPELTLCRACGRDLAEFAGGYTWVHDPLNHPWKIQCPACKRWFPTNDFASFYKLGLNEYGEFSRDRAISENNKLIEKGEEGYLVNVLYPEFGKDWGVDDGYGYVTGKVYPNGIAERHTYIAEYMHFGIFNDRNGNSHGNGVVVKAFRDAAYAYFYTGDKKYGRCAAIILDRIADFYPDYDIMPYHDIVWNSHGGSGRGRILGCIWECFMAEDLAIAYDMVFDMYEDPFVLEYIKNKSKEIKMRHAKKTPSQIRTNIEDGILRPIFKGLRECTISGNFGFPQAANAMAAVVLDTFPETEKELDYLLAAGWTRNDPPSLGGGINQVLVDVIDADGMGDESSGYNIAWLTYLISVADILKDYKGYSAANLYSNPKFVRMFYSLLPMTLTHYSPEIGDTSHVQSNRIWITPNIAQKGFENLGDVRFAQTLYYLNGNTAEGLHHSITEKDPERLKEEIEAVIKQNGKLSFNADILPAFGFAALNDGVRAEKEDCRRNAWMYFGSNGGHGHRDTLELGMTSFGLNILPDLGYPEQTGYQPNRLQWIRSTLSHNTVMVNEHEQVENIEVRGKIKHYDAKENIKLIDVAANYVYPETEEYRRSVITVKADEKNSYTVDLFRVLGGEDHLYSFHAAADEIESTEGITFIPQKDETGSYTGSYAGADVPFGKDPNSPADWFYDTAYPRGYTWLHNVDRADEQEEKYSFLFKIRDYNKRVENSEDLWLKTTVLDRENRTDGAKTEVATADGYPSHTAANANVPKLRYLLIKRKGEDLNTVFTLVHEPYKKESFIKEITELPMTLCSGEESRSAAHRAIKVELKSGRCDYIFYSTQKENVYKVSDNGIDILFSGFVGACFVENGKKTYCYVCDGTIIDEPRAENPDITGKVSGFTETCAFENEITLKTEKNVSPEELKTLAGRLVLIDNGEDRRDAAYKIISAEKKGEEIILNIGGATLIRKHKDASREELGYEYNISAGNAAVIPLSYEA